MAKDALQVITVSSGKGRLSIGCITSRDKIENEKHCFPSHQEFQIVSDCSLWGSAEAMGVTLEEA